MQVAIVSSASVARFGRMDPTFHIAVKRVEPVAKALEAKHDARELLARLERLQARDLTALRPLLTGDRHFTREAALAVARKYPFLAYALVLEDRENIRTRAQKDSQSAAQYLDAVDAL